MSAVEEKKVAAGTAPSIVDEDNNSSTRDSEENGGVLGTMQTNSTTSPIIDFKTLTWWQGGIVLVAETVSLGILSLPSVMAALGLVPGIILILVMSVLSTWSGLMLGEFRKQHPSVENFGDAVEVIGKSIGMGPLFQEIFGWAQVTFQVFVMGAHLLTWTICLDTIHRFNMEQHGNVGYVCKIVWAVIGLIVFAVLNLPRTLKLTSWTSVVSCLSITIATLMTVGYVATNKPMGGVSLDIATKTKFTTAFLMVSNISVAFSSHSCFFGVIGEFKNPDDWPKALALLQFIDTSLYLIAAVVIYVYVGPNVPSPALLSAKGGMLIAIWVVAIPTIVIAGVIYGHVAGKYVFGRIFRNSKHVIRRTKISTITWVAMIFGMWAIAMVIAESIPIFNSLLGLLAALFVSWFSYGLPGIFWLWMHYGNWFSSPSLIFKFVANVILVITGVLLCVLGLWSTVQSLIDDLNAGIPGPWSCGKDPRTA